MIAGVSLFEGEMANIHDMTKFVAAHFESMFWTVKPFQKSIPYPLYLGWWMCLSVLLRIIFVWQKGKLN